MKIETQSGRVVLGSRPVQVVFDEENFKVIEIDLNSKYAGEILVAHNDDDGTITFDLIPGPDTIKLDESATDDATVVVSELSDPVTDWIDIVAWRRYTVYIALYRIVYPDDLSE